MNVLVLEIFKSRRTGMLAALPAVGVLGAAYAWANFHVRGDTLLSLPLPPMDVLLTQLYGVMMVLNLFAIVVAACLAYHMEFAGNALRKMYLLPVSVPRIYLCKFAILTLLLVLALAVQNGALAVLGLTRLPVGTFDAGALTRFSFYSLCTCLPVLSFMLLVASRFACMWIPLGTGVAGFLSAMALSNVEMPLTLAHPFILMLKPALAMSAQPDLTVLLASLASCALFLCMGLLLSRRSLDA